MKGDEDMYILDAARYLVYLSYGENCYSLTPLKLQKILYYAQGWSYVWDDVALFKDSFEAWQYGPVNRLVYDTFKTYKYSEIPEFEGSIPVNAKPYELETIDAVWKRYGVESATDLVEMTHNEEPWLQAYGNGEKIYNLSIKSYFRNKY